MQFWHGFYPYTVTSVFPQMVNFQFLFPLFLLLIPLAGLPWLKRKHQAVVFPGAILFKTPSSQFQKGSIFRALASGALLFLIIAMSRPVWITPGNPLQIEGMAIQIVIDTSGSMSEMGNANLSRFDAGVRAIHHFLGQKTPDSQANSRPNDLAGLISFAALPKTEVPLTLDHHSLLSRLRRLAPKQIPGESETNLPDALILAMDQCKKAGEIPKVLLLITDGENNVPNPISTYSVGEAASLAQAAGFRIHVVDAGGYGFSNPTMEKTKRETAEKQLKSLAGITKGLYFSAENPDSFIQAFSKIHAKEKAVLETRLTSPRLEFYPWLGAGSLILFLLSVFISGSPWKQLP